MAVIISMLRGVNVGGHKMVKMQSLCTLCGSLGLREAQTYLQSGNVIFRTDGRDMVRLCKRIEDGIEKTFGFRSDVILRTPADLRDVVATNPFAARCGIDPKRLAVTFLSSDPGKEAREKLLAIKAEPEELRIEGRELYIYYPHGMARPKLTWPIIERTLKTSGTSRNWNTVTKLLEIGERYEAGQ
jgi:uncharacterized protein (DUF1697 family)